MNSPVRITFEKDRINVIVLPNLITEGWNFVNVCRHSRKFSWRIFKCTYESCNSNICLIISNDFWKNEILFINSKWSKFYNNINYVKSHELNFKIIKYIFQIYFLKLNYLSYKKKNKKNLSDISLRFVFNL